MQKLNYQLTNNKFPTISNEVLRTSKEELIQILEVYYIEVLLALNREQKAILSLVGTIIHEQTLMRLYFI